MGTVTPKGNKRYITDLDIRIWLRDTDPEANLLLKDFEFGQEELRTAMTLAVDYWNEVSPLMLGYNYDINNFPYRYHLLMGTCANLLFIAANAYRRNKLPYNIGGGTVNDQDKDQPYDAAGAKLWEQYKEWVARKKRELNMTQCWGRV